MEIRHDALREIFRGLSGKVDQYFKKQAETCVEEHGSDPTEFYECVQNNTSNLRDNMYKFENLSLYADLRERECRQDGEDYEECVKTLAQDIKKAAGELDENFE